MSLPSSFSTPIDYFKECLTFFDNYQFLYNCPNTDLLVNNVLDHINIENLENINIFDKHFDVKACRETFLEDFFTKLDNFTVVYDVFESVCDGTVDAPLSAKKKHEIEHLVKEIEDMCEHSGCETVVDFGAGLGYLDQLLYQTTKYRVLGIECNDSHYVGAKKRQLKYHTNSRDHVKYIKHTINEDSQTKIQEYLTDKFTNHGNFCITGLHACADLTITALNIFLKMADAKSMVLMPCCYHLMMVENGRFKNFPLSSCLKRLFEDRTCYQYMDVPFLRLGAHPPGSTDDLEKIVFSLLTRAVLQVYAHNHGCRLKRNKRKTVKKKELNMDFEAYIRSSALGYTLIPRSEGTEEYKDNTYLETSIQFDITELNSIWRQISQDLTFKKAGIFILLQRYLQPVIENFTLYDRLVYLKEKGIENCRYKKIFNETISPRCLALLVCK